MIVKTIIMIITVDEGAPGVVVVGGLQSGEQVSFPTTGNGMVLMVLTKNIALTTVSPT